MSRQPAHRPICPIDPAAHDGHREFDLAMMLLFGGFELHQIAPFVVHAIKSGGSYVPAATRAIRRYV